MYFNPECFNSDDGTKGGGGGGDDEDDLSVSSSLFCDFRVESGTSEEEDSEFSKGRHLFKTVGIVAGRTKLDQIWDIEVINVFQGTSTFFPDTSTTLPHM
jgi:hypothetical protein